MCSQALPKTIRKLFFLPVRRTKTLLDTKRYKLPLLFGRSYLRIYMQNVFYLKINLPIGFFDSFSVCFQTVFHRRLRNHPQTRLSFPQNNRILTQTAGQSVLRQFVDTVCGYFQKKCTVRSRVCRTALNQSALESTNPGASNGGSNFEIKAFGADLVDFEVTRLPQIWELIDRSFSRKC